MLKATGLSFSYQREVPILSGIDIAVQKGEIVALVGASGCGKSTLLRVLAGLETKQSGHIDWLADKNFSFVFQDAALMPWATVADNVALPFRIAGKKYNEIISTSLAEVGLAGYEQRFPTSLSGGQKMRVSIARALAAEPSVMFLDEPFSALDEILRFQMNELLLRVRSEHDLACIFVTHSIYEAAYLADRVLVMSNGRIIGSYRPMLDRSLSAVEQRTSAEFFEASAQISGLLAEGKK